MRATPAVRKLASEQGIDISQIEGTGLGGRVSRKDVEDFIAQRQSSQQQAAARVVPAQPQAPSQATPARASAVIIGAGIVGNSLVHHLALLGWRDLVLVDKGPMPNPGGSTGHASNFIFPIEYSKMMFELTEDSTAQYKELGVFTQSGGIEVARTPERMIELKRRCSQAKAWGIPAELVTPGEVNKLVPYLDESVILGGAHFPTVGVVDSLRAGTLMREEAEQAGALTVLAGTDTIEGSVVRHEMLHALVRAKGHPRAQFLQRCGGIVACGPDCVHDAGPAAAPAAGTPVVRAMALKQ